jgi:hypothetical protein
MRAVWKSHATTATIFRPSRLQACSSWIFRPTPSSLRR